jgi:tRNA (guanine37-N1)-methyltransferase
MEIMVEFDVLTAFPQFYRPHLEHGLIGKGIERGKVDVRPWSLRRFTPDDYGEIDDRAYGGEFGMVMKPGPYFRGVEHVKETRGDAPVLLTSPDGRRLDNEAAKSLSERDQMIILTGRYEGVDQRVRDEVVDECWSIGPYVTPGGDLPALVMISAIIRHVSGVVGNQTSVERDSFQDDRLAPPHYTRPETFRGHSVPEVLRSGHHEKIKEWRREQAQRRTEQWQKQSHNQRNATTEE